MFLTYFYRKCLKIIFIREKFSNENVPLIPKKIRVLDCEISRAYILRLRAGPSLARS